MRKNFISRPEIFHIFLFRSVLIIPFLFWQQPIEHRSDFPSEHQFSWRHPWYSVWIWCYSIFAQKLLDITIICTSTICFFKGSFESVNKPFSLPIWPWMVWWGCDVINSQSFTKCLKFTSYELGPIVTDNFLWYPETCKQFCKKIFCYRGSWSFALKNFRSFGIAIYNYQVIVTIHGSSIIYVEPGPWNICFWPWCEFYWRCFHCQLTPFTRFNYLFNIFVHIWPISVTPHKDIHTSNTRIPHVEIPSKFVFVTPLASRLFQHKTALRHILNMQVKKFYTFSKLQLLWFFW